MRSTTAAYRKSMANRVRKSTTLVCTFTYSGQTTGYIGGSTNQIINLKATETVDILGRSLPTETLVIKARMNANYNMASPSGDYGAFQTGATVILNYRQKLDDGTYTTGCGTSDTYMDYYKCTAITRDRKDNTYTFTCKSRLTCCTKKYTSNSEWYNLYDLAMAALLDGGITAYSFDFSASLHPISASNPGLVVAYEGQKDTDILQKIAQATGRALYTYNNQATFKQWSLSGDPVRYLSKADYYLDGITRTEASALKSLAIESSNRVKESIDTTKTGDDQYSSLKSFGSVSVPADSVTSITFEHDSNKEAYFVTVDEMTGGTTAFVDVDTRNVYSTTLKISNSGSTAALWLYNKLLGVFYRYDKETTTYTASGVTEGQDIKVSGNSWLYPDLVSDLQSRYISIYALTTTIKVSYRGLQELYPGDIIAIEDEDGVWQKMIITGTVMSYDGALSGELTGLWLGALSGAPALQYTDGQAILDSDGNELIMLEREAYQTSNTAAEIDAVITSVLGE